MKLSNLFYYSSPIFAVLYFEKMNEIKRLINKEHVETYIGLTLLDYLICAYAGTMVAMIYVFMEDNNNREVLF